MSELIDEIGDLWNISLDILGFYHECCYNCQPRDSGEYVWLSEKYVLGDELGDIVTRVCEINNHDLITEINYHTLEEALDGGPFTCPNCGTDHIDAGNEIGGEWLLARGHQTESATYLLTRTFWPYLTHYTKTDEQYATGLQRLCAIIDSGIIYGTHNGVDGSRAAVCFTECSPLEITEMLRVMELKHDELPYRQRGFEWRRSKHGIAIKRDALIRYGGRPVLHGDSEIRQKLQEGELWRFKLFDPEAEYGDWTFEREFRVPDVVVLSRFDARDIILIVEDEGEQFRLLAQRDVPIYAILPFNFVYSTDNPYPHRSDRQIQKDAERFL